MSRGTGSRLFRAETLMLGVFLASLAAAAVPARADDDDDDSPSVIDRWGDSIKHGLDKARGRVGIGPKPDAPPPSEAPSGCPSIAILDGTTSQRVSVAGGQGNQGVRYQYSLATVGRQCTNGASSISIRVAAGGRVLLGPAGTPGSFAIPIRVVVFNERSQKPQASKLFKVPASIASGQAATPFQFVSDDIVVPASGNAAREYSIKIGIDAAGGGGDVGAPRKGRHRKAGVDSASR